MSGDSDDEGVGGVGAPPSSPPNPNREPCKGDDAGGGGAGGGGRRTTPSKDNTKFSSQSYWDERFANEEQYDWLLTFSNVEHQLIPYLRKFDADILVVGCGNSSFSADLYDAGYTNVTNVDYSSVVVENMRRRHGKRRPRMKWEVMDMTNLTYPDASFDVVIDKAAMDALMTDDEGDVWNPNRRVIDSARRMCHHVSRVLRPGGYHLQISFAQPHFRTKYLLGVHSPGGSGGGAGSGEGTDGSAPDDGHGGDDGDRNNGEGLCEFGWDCKVQTIGSGDGCFHHFLYVMYKMK